MILLEHVSFSYPAKSEPVFTDLTLKIDSHSWVAVSGPDAAGKTTLCKLMKGILTADEGSIEVQPGGDAPAIGYIGGDPAESIVGVSVEEDLAFGLENLCMSPKKIRESLEFAVRSTGLEGLEKRLTHTLSGGEQQKVALAGCIGAGANILILDEAMGMLDRSTRRSIRRFIKELARLNGLTVIEVTNFPEEILDSDRVLFLTKGSISFDGLPGDFMTSTWGRRWIGASGGLTGLMGALFEQGVLAEVLLKREILVKEIRKHIK